MTGLRVLLAIALAVNLWQCWGEVISFWFVFSHHALRPGGLGTWVIPALFPPLTVAALIWSLVSTRNRA